MSKKKVLDLPCKVQPKFNSMANWIAWFSGKQKKNLKKKSKFKGLRT